MALKVAAVAVAVFLLADFGVLPLYDAAQTSSAGIEKQELTLRRYQRWVAGAASQQAAQKAAQEKLSTAEAGLLASSSESMADAEWQRVVRELAQQQGLELTSSEVLRIEKLSPDYALVTGRVALAAHLYQLVGLLVALANSPKLLDATSLAVRSLAGDPQERLQIEMTVSAAMRAAQAGGDAKEKR